MNWRLPQTVVDVGRHVATAMISKVVVVVLIIHKKIRASKNKKEKQDQTQQ